MSSETNKQTVRRWVDEVIVGGDLNAPAGLMTEDYVNSAFPPGLPQGVTGERQFTAMFRSAFPDYRFEVEDTLAEDDTVAVRYTFSGTHAGDFMGVPATGKSFSVTGINFLTLSDGRIARNVPLLDMLGLLQQIGAAPPPA